MTETLTITRPDDWHVHLRDAVLLPETVAASAKTFGRAIVMPNVAPPITTLERAQEYRQRIEAARPDGSTFTPLMTLYLTEATTPEAVRELAAGPIVERTVTACKLYPAGATTNSASGVTDPKNIYHVLEAMQEVDIPLLIHGEVVDDDVDIFDREAVFIERHLEEMRREFPDLRIVLEHLTTRDAVQWVGSQEKNTGATITPHHLMMNRNDILVGGIKPHNYCLPVLKSNVHQQALQEIVVSGDPRYFLGTDSAPHPRDRKENWCGNAGCYSAAAALPLYATLFEQLGALDKLEGFASHFGPDFYKLPRHQDTITLQRESMTIPEKIAINDTIELVPWQAGQTIPWSVAQR